MTSAVTDSVAVRSSVRERECVVVLVKVWVTVLVSDASMVTVFAENDNDVEGVLCRVLLSACRLIVRVAV